MPSAPQPTKEYRRRLKWCADFHAASKTFTGARTFKNYATLEALVRYHQAKTMIDWGCGKGRQFVQRNVPVKIVQGLDRVFTVIPSLQEGLQLDTLLGYDPAVPEYRTLPIKKFDGLMCIDVLEYIPPADLAWFLEQACSFTCKFAFFNFSCVAWDGKKPMRSEPHELAEVLKAFEPIVRRRPELDIVLRVQTVPWRRIIRHHKHPEWQEQDRSQLWSAEL